MSQPKITEPTETIQLPAPSWAPAVFAFGILGLVAGTFASGFIFPMWSYAAAGAVFAVFGLASMIGRGKRSFYSLPRESSPARAELPIPSFKAPTRD